LFPKPNQLLKMKSYIIGYRLLLLSLVILLFATSCNIEEIVYEENPFVQKKNKLLFQALQQSNQSIYITDSLIVQAVATGDGLSFEWWASDGKISANGSTAVFKAMETGVYEISCTVTDSYNNRETKQINVSVVMELVFDGIASADTLLPPNLITRLTAYASGEELQFNWSCNGGEIIGTGSQVDFKSGSVGNFNVQCVVTDMHGVSKTQTLTLQVTDQLIYKSLTATSTTLKPYEVTVITALAYGEGLTYEWDSRPMAVMLGYYESVNFSNCHGDTYNVSCRIKDSKGNSEIKYITITILD